MFDTTLPSRPRPLRRTDALHQVRRRALLARSTALAIVLALVAPLLAAAVANPGADAIVCSLAALIGALCAFGCLQPLLPRRNRA